MNTKIVFIVLIVFIAGFISGMTTQLILFGPTGPSNGSTNDTFSKFIGTWEASEQSQNVSNPGTLYYTYEFHSNSTMYINTSQVNQSGTKSIDIWRHFTITDTQLKISMPTGGTVDYGYSFSDNDQKLTLSASGASLIFTKQ